MMIRIGLSLAVLCAATACGDALYDADKPITIKIEGPTTPIQVQVTHSGEVIYRTITATTTDVTEK
jgi:hypothetical protein